MSVIGGIHRGVSGHNANINVNFGNNRHLRVGHTSQANTRPVMRATTTASTEGFRGSTMIAAVKKERNGKKARNGKKGKNGKNGRNENINSDKENNAKRAEAVLNNRWGKILANTPQVDDNCEQHVVPVMGNNLSLPMSNSDSDNEGESRDVPSPLPGDEYVL